MEGIYELQFEQDPSAQVVQLKHVTYADKQLVVFFILMLYRRITAFKSQWRWMASHPVERAQLGFERIPDRSTLSRRYKRLYPVVQALVVFMGQNMATLDERLEGKTVYEDKSLFKACGPVWHESDRRANHVPDRLRHLDRDASWSKSGYHGWVYGYGLHLTCNQYGFPKAVQVETGSVSEQAVLAAKMPLLFNTLQAERVVADNGYVEVKRIRDWAKQGVLLLTPALKWKTGRYAAAYHRLIRQPTYAALLKQRRTAIEPFFDLCAQTLHLRNNHKQLPVQHLANVRTYLALAVFALQLAMVVNSLFDSPLHAISPIHFAFS